MNIKLSLVCIIILSTTAALSNEGAYVGGFLGHNNFDVGFKSHPVRKKDNERNLGYGIFVGYGAKIEDCYMGIELGIANGYPNDRHSYIDITNNTWKKHPNSWRYNKGIAFSISPRAGFFVNNDYMVYSKLGIEISRDKASCSGFNMKPMSRSKTFTNLVPSVGIEKVFPTTTMRVEYAHDFGKSIKIEGKHALGYTNQQIKVGFTVKI